MPPVKTFRVNGPALRAIREGKELSLRQLAKRCGLHRHPQGLRKLETEDGKAVSESFAREIAGALQVSVSDFTDAPEECEYPGFRDCAEAARQMQEEQARQAAA